MSQIVNAEDSFSNSESIPDSEAGSDAKFDEDIDLFLGVLATELDQDWKQKIKKLKASQTNTSKCAKLPNKIFDYILVARC